MSFTGPQKLLISYGDYCIFYINPKEQLLVLITPDASTTTRVGKFIHSNLVSQPFGKKVLSSNSQGFVHLLHPTPELWTVILPHRTQILYRADISLILMYLRIQAGSRVLEAGTGSGSFSHSVSRSIGPTGVLWSYEYHLERQLIAKKEFEEHGLTNINSIHRDICISGIHIEDEITSIFLDLPSPWLAIGHPSFKKAFKSNRIGFICSFSPSIEQVSETCKALHATGWSDIKMYEVLAMEHMFSRVGVVELPKGREGNKRKHDEGVVGSRIGSVRGHTSYLTFATLLPQ